MPDYSKAKLYSIRSHHTEDIYIGSTCHKLSHRLYGHRKKYEYYKNGKYHYVSSFEIIKYPDNYIELIRAVPCANKQELHKLEGHEIRSNKCVNKHIAGRKKAEYRTDNKEKIKKYYLNNRDHINQNSKNRYQDNKTHLKELQIKNYKKKKDIRQCLCGGKYNCGNKFQRDTHSRSKKHQKYISDFYNRLSTHLTQ